MIITGVLFADWATSDQLTLQYHGWPEVLRRHRSYRLCFHLTGIALILLGIIPFFVYNLEAGLAVTVILVTCFLLGVLQIFPLILFRSFERLRHLLGQ
jgi:predicted membrane channel-forming protein YqfA (hemolysin III family)